MINKKYYYPANKEYIITVVPDDATHGTTSGGGTYLRGTSVTISASALSGYDFVSWDDGNTSSTRTIVVTQDKTYTATFQVHRANIMLSSNANAEDAYVMYNGTKYNTNTTIRMLENETCTLYTLPKHDTWNNIQSSYRLPFMRFGNSHGTVSNQQTLANEYICATYTASSYDDTISQAYGTVGASTANVQVGYPQVKSANTTPFTDSSAKYVYVNPSSSHWKGAGYFISDDYIINDTSDVISANFQFDHFSTHNDWTTTSNNPYTENGVNASYGAWGTNSAIDVTITIPSSSPYEFVKWKIDRMDYDYRYVAGGSGIFHIYQDDSNNYGNDYFEKYYNTSFTQQTCSIPWPRCHVQITPILQLKTT